MENNFSPKEKAALFDDIFQRYFCRNFGTMLKSDIDTLIFSAYIEHCLDNGLPYDDYTLSIDLGITEAKVRTLKERKQLQYPRKEYKWKDAFVALIPNARYDKVKHLVKLNIEDVNLIKDLRYFVRSNGWYDEYQLNPHLFQCRLDCFIDLCSKLDEDVVISKETKAALKKLARNDDEATAIDKIINHDFAGGFKELFEDDILPSVLDKVPFGGVAQKAIKELVKIIKRNIS